MTTLAFGGASIDGGLYTWITDLAQRTPHALDSAVSIWSNYGLALFAVLMLAAWWRARPAGPERMAMALAVPVTVVASYVLNDIVKSLFDEARPCQTLHTVIVDACPAVGDWSFPSNHSAIAAAAAVALLVADRRIGRIAVPAALLMGASRVWIGVHYPHDVVVGLIVGALAAWPLALLSRRAAPIVERARGTKLRTLLTAE